MKPRALSDRERIDWLRLARAKAVGPVTFAHLISRYGSAGAALEAVPDLVRRGGRAGSPDIPGVAIAEAELAAGAAAGARLVAAGEPAFPPLLAALDPPPPLIWALGDMALFERRAVALVGARIASGAGRRFARTLAAALGEAGYVVASGMARGIDAAAHEGSLPFGAVAVLAGGVDDVYPPDNAGLYAALKAKGCVISERAMGHKARAADFPRRNRLISGAALGVVVVEAELRSGSLITARLAGEQGREVFAVPGSPLDPRARGCNDLIRQGATLVEGVEDVLRVLDAQPGVMAREAPSYDLFDEREDAETAGLRATVEDLLSPTPIPIDELARAAAAPTSAVLAALMELALAGRAELLPGGLAVRG
ncbi:MAG: DNA-processing protein DprA [Caulobacteraceae bacterium]